MPSAHCAQKSWTFFWWQERQNQRPLQEKASRWFSLQWSQRIRAKPLGKIAESLEGEISVESEWLTEDFSVLDEDRARIDPALRAQVAGVLERREAVRARYQTFAGKLSSYELHPLHLLACLCLWLLIS